LGVEPIFRNRDLLTGKSVLPRFTRADISRSALRPMVQKQELIGL
jgi:hypothetical protein